jgi:hypothetical protein
VNLRTGKPEPGGGYAWATIAHALAVVGGFYDFHLHYGRGPLVNPVPQGSARRKALGIALRWSSLQAIAGPALMARSTNTA